MLSVPASPGRILVAEDDRKTAELIALYLRHDGHRVDVEHAGDAALARSELRRYDLLVLDVMLPGIDGLEVCRRVRARSEVPIVLVTARGLEEQRVEGLRLGADDYVPKPFSLRELAARVNAVLRRTPPGSADMLHLGEVCVDRSRRTVHVAGREVDLTPTEFALLERLMARPGHVHSRSQLLNLLPGGPARALDRTVDVHIRNLRRKIEPAPDEPIYVQTVLGAGYRFVPRAPPPTDPGVPHP